MPTHVEILSAYPPDRLGDRLTAELKSNRWLRLYGAVAYVKMSGVRHVGTALYAFSRSSQVRITVGIDQQGSSLEGVQSLWLLLGSRAGSMYVLNNPAGSPSSTFHPKIWLFEALDQALLISGSGNLTGGGLFTNYEFGSALTLDLSDPDDDALRASVRRLLDEWADDALPEVTEVTVATLRDMHGAGELPSESAMRAAGALARTARAAIAGVQKGARLASGLFVGRPMGAAPAAVAFPPLPPPPVAPQPAARVMAVKTAPKASGGASSAAASVAPLHDALLIVVNPRNKTEIFLAKRLLKEDPAFFGWPFLGRTKPKMKGNPGQPQPDPLPTASVVVYSASGSVAGQIIDNSLKLWTYSYGPNANDDFRLTLIGGLNSMVPDGSILVMTRQPASGYDYAIEVFPPGHANHARLLAECTEKLPQGREFGWR